MEDTILTIDKLAKAKKKSNEKLPVKEKKIKASPKKEENTDKQIVPANG